MARGQGSQNLEMEPGGATGRGGQGRRSFPRVSDAQVPPALGPSLSLSGAAECARLSPGARSGV